MRGTRSPKRWLLGAAAALLLPAGLVGYSMLPSDAATAPAAGTTYQLAVKKSGMCIDLPAAAKANGTLLQQWGCSMDAPWQQFKVVAAGSHYQLVNVSSGKCIDVPAASSTSGQRLQQWSCGSGTNQQWRFVASGSGTHQIVSVSSGLCISDQAASTSAGAAIVQETCTGNSNKQWTFNPVTAPAGSVTAPAGSLVVAADGTGSFTSVQAAVDAVPASNPSRVTIAIKPGTYRGHVTVPANKPFVTFKGLGAKPEDVRIVNNESAAVNGVSGATTLVQGKDFAATNVTFANDYDEAAHGSAQALALNLSADRAVLTDVRVLADQDTLLVNNNVRAYFRNSYIEGTVDFIYGTGTAVFDACRIYEKRTTGGPITASAAPAAQKYGLLFYKSTVTGATNATTQLGRPWRQDAQVLYRESNLSATVKTTQPWTNMGTATWQKARFFEYRNTGAGAAGTANRPQLTDAQAADYTPQKYLAGTDGWNPVAATTATTATAAARTWSDKADGFASTGGGTTGGAGGTTVTVTSYQDLVKYATAATPYVIRVAGSITYPTFGYEIPVTSNKTLIGVGTKGELVHGGIVLKIGVHNVIIRNLTIRDAAMTSDDPGDKVYDYDGIQMDTADHIWIDHNRIERMNDGLIDSRKDTSYLTVSWNVLSGEHKAFGIGWTPNVTARMTLHHNWIHDNGIRNPSTDNVAYAHLYNNYMQNITGYGNYSRGATKMVLENSYFDNVKDPYYNDATAQLKQSGSIVINSTGKTTTSGSAFTPSAFYAYTLDRAADVPALVKKYAGPQPNIGT